MREQVGLHHRPHHHGAAGARGGGRGGVVLAHGVPAQAQARRPAAASAGVPEPAVHHAGAPGRALAGLLLVSPIAPSRPCTVIPK